MVRSACRSYLEVLFHNKREQTNWCIQVNMQCTCGSYHANSLRGCQWPTQILLIFLLPYLYGSNEHTTNIGSQLQVVSEIWAPEKHSHAPFFSLPPRYFAANWYTGWITPNLLSKVHVVYIIFSSQGVLQNPQLSWRTCTCMLLFAIYGHPWWPHEWSDCFYILYAYKLAAYVCPQTRLDQSYLHWRFGWGPKIGSQEFFFK